MMQNNEIGNLVNETAQPITEEQITAIVDLCAANGKMISREHAKEFIIANNKQLEAEKNMSFKDRMKNLQNNR